MVANGQTVTRLRKRWRGVQLDCCSFGRLEDVMAVDIDAVGLVNGHAVKPLCGYTVRQLDDETVTQLDDETVTRLDS